jgi:hypothetical protein
MPQREVTRPNLISVAKHLTVPAPAERRSAHNFVASAPVSGIDADPRRAEFADDAAY